MRSPFSGLRPALASWLLEQMREAPRRLRELLIPPAIAGAIGYLAAFMLMVLYYAIFDEKLPHTNSQMWALIHLWQYRTAGIFAGGTYVWILMRRVLGGLLGQVGAGPFLILGPLVMLMVAPFIVLRPANYVGLALAIGLLVYNVVFFLLAIVPPARAAIVRAAAQTRDNVVFLAR